MRLILLALFAFSSVFANESKAQDSNATANNAESLAQSLKADSNKNADPDSRLKDEILTFERLDLKKVRDNLIMSKSDPFIYTQYIPTDEEREYAAKMERAVLTIKSIFVHPSEQNRKEYIAHINAKIDNEQDGVDLWVRANEKVLDWQVVNISEKEVKLKFGKIDRTIGVANGKARIFDSKTLND